MTSIKNYFSKLDYAKSLDFKLVPMIIKKLIKNLLHLNLVVLLLLSIVSIPVGATDIFTKAENAYNQLPTSLSGIGRLVEKYFLNKKYSQPRSEELIFIKNHPDAALVIANSGCAAMKISYGVCGINILNHENSRAWSEESDSIRHFVFSALLTCSRGQSLAERYTIAHEGPPPWTIDNKMDIFNNYQGFEWANPQYGRCLLPDIEKRLAIAALKKIIKKELVVLVAGDTLCADPVNLVKRIERMNDEDFHTLMVNTYSDIKKQMPDYCF